MRKDKLDSQTLDVPARARVTDTRCTSRVVRVAHRPFAPVHTHTPAQLGLEAHLGRVGIEASESESAPGEREGANSERRPSLPLESADSNDSHKASTC